MQIVNVYDEQTGQIQHKVMCFTDTHSSYLYIAYVYVGKESDGATLSEEEKAKTRCESPIQMLLWIKQEYHCWQLVFLHRVSSGIAEKQIVVCWNCKI
jgi:hypothetical protein